MGHSSAPWHGTLKRHSASSKSSPRHAHNLQRSKFEGAGNRGPESSGDPERVSVETLSGSPEDCGPRPDNGPDLRAGGVHGGGEWRRPPRKRGFRRSLAGAACAAVRHCALLVMLPFCFSFLPRLSAALVALCSLRAEHRNREKHGHQVARLELWRTCCRCFLCNRESQVVCFHRALGPVRMVFQVLPSGFAIHCPSSTARGEGNGTCTAQVEATS